MSEWQPIETAPKEEDILVWMWGSTMIVCQYDSDAIDACYPWATLDGPSYAIGAPTHWMPLPEPPK